MAALRPTASLKAHPKLGKGGILPALTKEEYVALKESIRADGIKQQIVVTRPEMVILDGYHRWRAATELGLEEVPVMFEETGDDAAHVRLGLALNVARRHMTGDQKREAAEALLKANPEQSDRAVAASVGLDHKTVSAVREEAEGRGEIPHAEARTDTKGRKQPARKPRATGGEKRKGPSVPDLVARVRAGMGMNGGRKAKDVAKEIGIGVQTFRKARYVLMLADDPDLTDREHETVTAAIEAMSEEGQVARAFSMVEPLVDQKWGTATGRGHGVIPGRAAEVRMNHFMRAFGTLVQACKMAADVEVPLLAPDKAASLADELGEAIKGAKHLQQKIKETIA